MSSDYHGYPVPERTSLTGQLARKIQIIGRLELEIGEIAACIGLGLLLIAIFLATSFLGWDGLVIVIRLGLIGLLGAGGRMLIFDHPGGMKYADWLLLWYRHRSNKRAGKLDYVPNLRRRARLVGTRYRQLSSAETAATATSSLAASVQPRAQALTTPVHQQVTTTNTATPPYNQSYQQS